MFHHIYTLLEGIPPGEVVRIPGAAVDEIGAAALHLPFAVTHLRRPLAGEVLAVDATPSAAGAYTSPIAAPLERALLRRSEAGRASGCRWLPPRGWGDGAWRSALVRLPCLGGRSVSAEPPQPAREAAPPRRP